MLNILIIGCGNIGKRHLFALLELKKKIKVQVLEKDDTKINLSKKINKNFNNYIKKFSQIETNTNLIICCTKAFNRDVVIKKALKFCSPKYVILEKISFQNMHIYNQMLKLFYKNKIKVWINFPLRYQSYYDYLKKIIFKNNPFFTMAVSLSKSDDLFSSGIHFLDLFLTNYISDIRFEFAKLAKVNKDKNNSRFNGKIVYTSKFKTIIILNSKSKFQQQINIFGSKNHYRVIFFSEKKDPWNKPKIRFYKNDKFIKNFNHLWQSQLTNLYINDILEKKNCKLPTLKKSNICNKLILNSVKKKLNLKKKTSLCPIT